MRHREIAKLVALGRETRTGVANEVEFSVHLRGRFTIITFRGTEASEFISGGGIIDLIRDIRFVPWYDKRTGWAHAGFLKGARNIVEDHLHLYISRKEPLILSGFSLGASTSLLAALMLSKCGYNVTEWVGFGCPRALLGERLLPFRTTNYKYGGDAATSLPPRFLGYRHAGAQTQLGEPGPFSLGDHRFSEYQSRMK